MGEEHFGDLERKAEGEEIEKPGLIRYRDNRARMHQVKEKHDASVG